jgi:hypothetical protein
MTRRAIRRNDVAPSPTHRDGKTLVVPPQERAARQTSVPDIKERQDFSLVLGGPLYQFLRRIHISGDALVRQRILVVVSILWLPLLALSILEGQAWGGKPAVPFLWDVEANVRFLVVVPLLIVAELIVHQRMRPVVRQFLDRNLIPEGAVPRFDAAIASAFRLRNSTLAEMFLIAAVYIVGVTVLWRNFVALSATATWYATPTPEGMTLSLTGRWYAYVSLPVFQFLLLRWYYRVLIWMRFLWQVSRIELSLIPTHPDRVGGLGFLGTVSFAFTPLAVAQGALLAGLIADRIFYLRATLPDFKSEIAVVVLFLLCIVLGPFLVFAPQLAAVKRTGLREYGTLAERYVREFDDKWLRGGAAAARETLVGSADIQSLADLGNSFEIVKTMRLAPITRDALLGLVVATLAPVAPLALTMMSLEELLKKLFGVLF